MVVPTATIPFYRTFFPNFDPAPRQSGRTDLCWFQRIFHYLIQDPTIVRLESSEEKPRHEYVLPICVKDYLSDHIHRLLTSSKSVEVSSTVRKVDDTTVVKTYIWDQAAISDALNLELVRNYTTIPVPRVKFIATSSISHRAHLFMEYIDGKPLGQLWPALSFYAKCRVAWTLRGYVKQLRRIRRENPGTINGSPCVGPLFPTSLTVKPFKSRDDLAEWMNKRLEVCKRIGKTRPNAPRFDGNWNIVFTHGNIIPKNILVANDGTLYLVDWSSSGFYPDWFEYASMIADDRDLPASWKLLTSFISGSIFGCMRSLAHNYHRDLGWAVRVGLIV